MSRGSETESRRSIGYALPGIMSWSAVVFALVGAVFFPRIWLAMATVFVAYFCIRMMTAAGFSFVGQRKINAATRVDWVAGECDAGAFGFAPADVRHVVIVPNFKEPVEILRRTLDALAAQHAAADRVIVVLGMEEREPDARAKAADLIEEYSDKFLHAMATFHPGNLPGEAPGKSSNEAWAAKQMRPMIDRLGVASELCTITSCDADSVLHPRYFAAVSRSFAADANRHRSFWQAPLFFYNNIWEVPAPVRLTTWLHHVMFLAELAMPGYEPLPISTYTMSLNLCEQCGWWDPAVIPEDWHSYLACLFETGDDVSIHSVMLPTHGDATDGEGFLDGCNNRFQQLKRHSWGAEDVGYIYDQLLSRKRSWRSATLFRFVQVLHDHVMRTTPWVVLTTVFSIGVYYSTLHWYDLGWRASIAENLAVLNVMMWVCTGFVISGLVLELFRCPPKTLTAKFTTVIEVAFMWLLFPVVGFYLGMLPAIDAQTRLMLGIPISYRLTPKRFTQPAAQESAA